MNVLIVDDILLNRYIIRETVKRLGFKWFEAENGKIAIEILQEHKIDIIFMDIEMPVMNGIETARAIRNLPPPLNKTKIVAITAYNPSVVREQLNIEDFDGIITKPYSLEKITQFLNN